MRSILTSLLLAFSSLICFGQNPNIARIGENDYRVRILPDNFHYEKVSHGNDNYAQAACMTMILNNFGLTVNQDALYTQPSTSANAPQDGVTGMNGPTPAAWGRAAHVFSDMINPDEETIFSELLNNRPLLAGIRAGNTEKPVVVVAMTFSVKYNDKGEKVGIIPNTVTIVNPATGAPATSTQSWSQFATAAAVLYTVKISFN